jgi:hypothetical protein
MDKDKIRSIVENSLKQGGGYPTPLSLPKALRIKSRIEKCKDIGEIIDVLKFNEVFLKRVFKLDQNVFQNCISELIMLK